MTVRLLYWVLLPAVVVALFGGGLILLSHQSEHDKLQRYQINMRERESVILPHIAQLQQEILPQQRQLVPAYVQTNDIIAAMENGRYEEADRKSTQHSVLDINGKADYSKINGVVELVALRINKNNVDKLNNWIAHSPNNWLPIFLRGLYHRKSAWIIRGNNFSPTVNKFHMEIFERNIQAAAADIHQALRLNNENPYIYSFMMHIMSDLYGNGKMLDEAFQVGVKKYGEYLPFYNIRLDSLQPKWGGSIEAMYAFVQQATRNVPRSSELRLLWFQLYLGGVNMASLNCYQLKDEKEQVCIEQTMARLGWTHLNEEIKALLDDYNVFDHYKYNTILVGLLQDVASYKHVDAFVSQFLSLAYKALGENHYALDRALGEIWFYKQDYPRAEKMYFKALNEVRAHRFSNETEKSIMLATLFDDLGALYERTSNIDKMLAYEEASLSIAIASPDKYRYQCVGYYKLQVFTLAIASCTQDIAYRDNLDAYYWRGLSYFQSNDIDLALSDLNIIANSEHHLRTDSLIKMSEIYDEQRQHQKMADLLNSHPEIFNTAVSNNYEMGTLYNNRCLAYMQIGALKKALDDCNESLKYEQFDVTLIKLKQIKQALGLDPDQ